MSEDKFTKGEWFVVEVDNETTVSCDDYDIFTCWTDLHDANLAAQSKAMYIQLSDISHMIGKFGGEIDFDFVKREIDAILAKARGEHD